MCSKNIIKAVSGIEERQAVGFVKHSIGHYQDCLDQKDIE